MSQPRCGEHRFAELSLDAMVPSRPLANYVPAVENDGLVFMSGHGPLGSNGEPVVVGRLGTDVDVVQGAAASGLAMTNLIFSLRGAIASLDRVCRIGQIHGYLRCAPNFTELDEVMAAASRIVLDVFGPEVGRHRPTVTAVSECALGLTVTIDAVFNLDESRDVDRSEVGMTKSVQAVD